MTDREIYDLFECIANSEMGGVPIAVAKHVLELFDENDRLAEENADLQEIVEEQERYMESNTVDEHADWMNYWTKRR